MVCWMCWIFVIVRGVCSEKSLGLKSVGKRTHSCNKHCVKSVGIWSYSDPHFPAFGLNMRRYSVSVHIKYECREIRTRIISNTDTFYAVKDNKWVVVASNQLNWYAKRPCCSNWMNVSEIGHEGLWEWSHKCKII